MEKAWPLKANNENDHYCYSVLSTGLSYHCGRSGFFQFSLLFSEVDTPIVPHIDKYPEWGLGVRSFLGTETGYGCRESGLTAGGKPTVKIFLFSEALTKTTTSEG